MEAVEDAVAPDEIEFVRKTISSAFWSVLYHERELARSHAKLKIVKTLLDRAGFDKLDGASALAAYERDDLDEFDSVPVYAQMRLGEAISLLRHHESGLKEAHHDLAMLTAVVRRADYSEEEVNFEGLRADAEKRLRKSEEEET